MFSSTIFIYVLTIAISFIGGFLFYYVMETDTKKNKRIQVDALSGQLINFILYMWFAKVLIQLPTFVKDPLAVLAYPSNALTFYLATVFTFIHLFVRYHKEKERLHQLGQTFIPVFIAAHFLFEFIQTVVIGIKSDYMLLVVYMIFTVLYTILKGKITEGLLQKTMISLWFVSQIILSLFFSTTIFGYVVGMIYFIGLIIFVFGMILYHKKEHFKMIVRNKS